MSHTTHHKFNPDDGTAFEDSRERVCTTDFNFDLLDDIANEGSIIAADPDREHSDLEHCTPEELAAAIKAFSAMLRWIWQGGSVNPDGLKIRAIICCWVFLHELRQHSMSSMARRFGLKKQSLGRWKVRFNREFLRCRVLPGEGQNAGVRATR